MMKPALAFYSFLSFMTALFPTAYLWSAEKVHSRWLYEGTKATGVWDNLWSWELVSQATKWESKGELFLQSSLTSKIHLKL